MVGDIASVLELARRAVKPRLAEPLEVVFRTSILESVAWDRQEIEQKLNLVLPDPLVDLWNATGSLRLFEDVTYGQWGLVVWSAAEALARTRQRITLPVDRKDGDLLLGTFLGDSDLLLVRCDPTAADYGKVIVELPLDRRVDWPIAGESIEAFLAAYVRQVGAKYWIRQRERGR